MIASLVMFLATSVLTVPPRRLNSFSMRKRSSAGTWAVCSSAVTIANGGDNLGVYIPLLARNPELVWLYAAVFAVMTGLWCLLAYRLIQHRVIGERVRRYGHVVLPFVLIGLGLWILWDARGLIV